MNLKACHCCGQIHQVPGLSGAQVAVCTRCGVGFAQLSTRSASRTAAAAMGAFILYWPAILLPILRIEKFGQHHESSLLVGTIELLREGSWFVGTVVLLFSIVFPLIKILLLLELSLLGLLHRQHKAQTYRAMELAGKWSMMDVMLLAFLVMLVKLGTLVQFQFGPAVWAFVMCVAMSIVASLCFDPHTIWNDEENGGNCPRNTRKYAKN
ncbi:MAG: paraquat-inducible protein A [Planctomycetes bacterium]|nr:paraquat-inducible protein A [Planctomycetota bacterium]